MQIPIESLGAETLRRVAEEFVTREGTDYGVSSADLNSKVEQVLHQLRRGQALLMFDSESETCHIVTKDNPLFRAPSTKQNGPHRVDEDRLD
ncbi:MAG: YheU family protein [Proteobacteria bacterium]|nr:MAG: YheU family protein [Pseudomonadota bacterium]